MWTPELKAKYLKVCEGFIALDLPSFLDDQGVVIGQEDDDEYDDSMAMSPTRDPAVTPRAEASSESTQYRSNSSGDSQKSSESPQN